MQVYKCVSEHWGGLYSVVPHGDYTLKYVPGKRTVPKIGKIFAFDSLEAAEGFQDSNIWLTEAKNICGHFHLHCLLDGILC